MSVVKLRFRDCTYVRACVFDWIVLWPIPTMAQIAIIGGGPHALAVLSALHERSYASPQFKDDAAYNLRVGFNSHKLVGTVTVIDPGETFCDMWSRRFHTLGCVSSPLTHDSRSLSRSTRRRSGVIVQRTD